MVAIKNFKVGRDNTQCDRLESGRVASVESGVPEEEIVVIIDSTEYRGSMGTAHISDKQDSDAYPNLEILGLYNRVLVIKVKLIGPNVDEVASPGYCGHR